MHVNSTCIAGDRFIDAVVDHLLSQVVWSLGLGIHAGSLSNRLQSRQDFNRA